MGDGVLPIQGFLLEALMACYWCIVIFLVPPYLYRKEAPKPMLLLACAPCFAFGKKFTGPSLSPVMAFATSAKAAVDGGGLSYDFCLVYGAGPMLGAILASVVLGSLGYTFPFRYDYEGKANGADNREGHWS